MNEKWFRSFRNSRSVRGAAGLALGAGAFCAVMAIPPAGAAPAGPSPARTTSDGPLSPDQADDCAATFADVLRRWPVVDRTDVPVLLASPRWKNESTLNVKDGPGFVRRLAEAITLRSGAKVRIADPGAAGCHYASEVALESSKDAHGQPAIVLVLRVIRPGLATPLIEQAFTVRKVTTTAPAFSFFGPPAAKRPSARPGSPQAAMSYQAISFERGTIHLESGLARQRVSVLGERTWRDASGQFCVQLRLLSRGADTQVEIKADAGRAEGQPAPTSRPVARRLTAFNPETVVFTFPRTAESYEVYITQR
jgi:hypothetical protein